ncbi:hypothetical protein [Nocardiopsis ansamitocini]|uniref:Uncharacterized protein n=1 Tax=Nocardiopsis ansamitocini TaxID=1670832 RepID=A0A9W6UJY1_9ACTN|nr:hypothetical protein [Nocardiopsis ansamitocini]GLU49172.1 hypothetical protein Nans01_35230 [Nocardiopsis ansamitocini]
MPLPVHSQPPLVTVDDPVVEHLVAQLRRVREDLADAHGAVIGDARVVHALTTQMWAGLPVPGVACHATADPLRLRAVSEPVTCRRCRARSHTGSDRIPGQTILAVEVGR